MRSFAYLLVTASIALHVCAAPFQNLGFDDQTAVVQGVRAYDRPVSELLPGWTLYQGDSAYPTMESETGGTLASTVATLVSATFPGGYDVQGDWGVFFRTQVTTLPFSLVQTAELPADAGQLTLSFQGVGFGLAINGRPGRVLNPGSWSSSGWSDTQMTAIYDLSEFAGQTVELRLGQLSVASGQRESFIDDLRIVAIPEVDTIILIIVGLVGLVGVVVLDVRRFVEKGYSRIPTGYLASGRHRRPERPAVLAWCHQRGVWRGVTRARSWRPLTYSIPKGGFETLRSLSGPLNPPYGIIDSSRIQVFSRATSSIRRALGIFSR